MAKKRNIGTIVIKLQKQVLKMTKAYNRWKDEQDPTAKALALQELDKEHKALNELNEILAEHNKNTD